MIIIYSSTYSTSLYIYRCMNNTDSMGGIKYQELDNVNIAFNFGTAIHNFLNQSVILWLCQPTICTLTFRQSNSSTTCQPTSAVDPISLVRPQLFVDYVLIDQTSTVRWLCTDRSDFDRSSIMYPSFGLRPFFDYVPINRTSTTFYTNCFLIDHRHSWPPVDLWSCWITLTSFAKKITTQHSPTCYFLCRFQETLKSPFSLIGL